MMFEKPSHTLKVLMHLSRRVHIQILYVVHIWSHKNYFDSLNARLTCKLNLDGYSKVEVMSVNKLRIKITDRAVLGEYGLCFKDTEEESNLFLVF